MQKKMKTRSMTRLENSNKKAKMQNGNALPVFANQNETLEEKTGNGNFFLFIL